MSKANEIEDILIFSHKTGKYNLLLRTLDNEDQFKNVVSLLNKWITTPSSRDTGLEIIYNIILNDPTVILQENTSSWLNYFLNLNTKSSLYEIRMRVFANVINKCHHSQEFTKTTISTYLPKLIEDSISTPIKSNQTEHSLNCIAVLCKFYGSTCGPHKAKIEKYVLKFIEADIPKNRIKTAGKCLHFLQQTGGAGTEGINHINNWSSNLKKLCSTFHKNYDALFENLTELKDYESVDEEPFNLEIIPAIASNLDVLEILSRRLKNLSYFLKSFLETEYPVPKNITPQVILDVIKRGLSIHKCISTEYNLLPISQFSVFLTGIQIELLQLFKTVMTCLKENLLPFSYSISKLFLDLFTGLKNCNCLRYEKNLNTNLHNTFNYWIKLVKSNFNPTFHDKFFNILVNEIVPKNIINITLSSNLSNKNLKSKRSIKELERNENSNLKLNKEKKQASDEEVSMYINCLETLTCLFQNVLISIKPQTNKFFIDTLMKILIKIQEDSFITPFSSIKYRISFYNLLAATTKQPRVNTSLLKIYINAFKQAQTYNSDEITEVCFNLMQNFEAICQPICRTLQVNVESAKNENQKEMDVEDDSLMENSEESFSLHVSSDQSISSNQNTSVDQNHSSNENNFLSENLSPNVDHVFCQKEDSLVQNIPSQYSKIIVNASPTRNGSKRKKIEILDVKVIPPKPDVTVNIEEETTEGDIQSQKEVSTDEEIDVVNEKLDNKTEKSVTSESISIDEDDDMLNSFVDELNDE